MDWSTYQFHSCPNWEIAFHASNMLEPLCIHRCCSLIILSYAWYIPECLLHVLPGRHLGMPLSMSLRVRSTLAMARDVFWDDLHQFPSTQLPFISISRVFPCICFAALFLSISYSTCLLLVLRLCTVGTFLRAWPFPSPPMELLETGLNTINSISISRVIMSRSACEFLNWFIELAWLITRYST